MVGHRKILIGLLLTLIPILPALAQQQSAEPQKSVKGSRIVLGSGSGEPGSRVVIPIYLSLAEGVKVGDLKIEIKFVSQNLKFAKVERGFAAEAGGVDLKSAVDQDKTEQGIETTKLTIATTPSDEQESPKGIPAGLLGYISFQINPEGKAAKIALRTAAEASALEHNNPIKDLIAVDSSVTVLASGSTPLVSCFFFSH